MENKVKTIYTREALIDFKKFTLTKDSFLKPVVLYIMCVAVIVCSFIYNRRFELNFTTVVYPLIAIIGSLLVTYIYYIAPNKTDDPMEDLEVEYTFDDEKIECGSESFTYSKLFGVYEDKYYYYVYTSESDGIILDKSDVEFDFKTLMKQKLPPKKLHFIKDNKNNSDKKPAHA